MSKLRGSLLEVLRDQVKKYFKKKRHQLCSLLLTGTVRDLVKQNDIIRFKLWSYHSATYMFKGNIDKINTNLFTSFFFRNWNIEQDEIFGQPNNIVDYILLYYSFPPLTSYVTICSLILSLKNEFLSTFFCCLFLLYHFD